MRISYGRCREGWRFAGCDILRPGTRNGEELMESRSRKSERRQGDGPERWRDPHRCVSCEERQIVLFSLLFPPF